jgi:hypothetical protein
MSSDNATSELLASIGSCLNAWSKVEDEITQLFMLIHGYPSSDYRHPLRRAFEAVVALEARLSMIKASVSADQLLSRCYSHHFNALYNKVTRSYRKRHEVAHFSLVHREGENGEWKILARPFFNWAAFQDNLGAELEPQQIEERQNSFLRLCLRIQQHRQYVGGKKGLPAEHFARAGDLVLPDLDEDDQSPEEP